NQHRRPISVYEVHLGSWRRVPSENNRSLTYREAADALADYVADLGFTHVELMPVMEHPFLGSWGYQVTGYFAPTRRYGDPDELRYLIDHLHRRGIGVILDWVPAHFPQDYFSLGRFDGTALYEHLDPRRGQHPEWGTYIFNFGRNEVRNFLLSSADFWLDSFHADGLRVDAVSSMLYLDYARKDGDWIPNIHGGNENLDAISFLRRLNEETHARHPGVLMIAEESTAWAGVSRPVYLGGLGFGFKWDMGWMHDTLEYFAKDPLYRRHHHKNLNFGMLYAYSENFILPLSHDEVVHGKGALLSKMSGDTWQQFANLRALYAYMWARPGKKSLFMGGEIGQWREWNHDGSLDWNLLDYDSHRGIQSLVRDLNRIYRTEPALHEADCEPAGFAWLAANDADDNVISFLRTSPSSGRKILCVCNFSPVPRHGFRVGVPKRGVYHEILNTDSGIYGGSNVGNAGGLHSDDVAWQGQPFSLMLTLPPLAVLYFAAPD
ncbi:MAG: 1,4-alpha-glucan branching protein GlgB, partial [Burkholderiales bacterium]